MKIPDFKDIPELATTLRDLSLEIDRTAARAVQKRQVAGEIYLGAPNGKIYLLGVDNSGFLTATYVQG